MKRKLWKSGGQLPAAGAFLLLSLALMWVAASAAPSAADAVVLPDLTEELPVPDVPEPPAGALAEGERLAGEELRYVQRDLPELGLLLGAFFTGVLAPGVEAAAGGRVHGAGHIALQHLLHGGNLRVGHGDGVQQGVGIRMGGAVKKVVLFSDFHDIAQIHDGDAVAKVLDHTEVVGDEDIGQVVFGLEVLHQVENLGLDGNIQG